jgi:NAD(P)H-hydrate epimerase
MPDFGPTREETQAAKAATSRRTPNAPDIYLTREEVREVDRRAVEQLGFSSLVLMENAGRGCADVLCQLGIHGPVLICCGRGNNGGDGFVIARHLRLRGLKPRVLLFCDPDELRGDAAANYQILTRCGEAVQTVASTWEEPLAAALAEADWVVDALLGTGSRGEPRPPLDAVIQRLNAAAVQRLAVDLPSGLDCDTGQPARATFRADHTCTFVALKVGFRAPAAQLFLGTVHVLDIGVPAGIGWQLP